MGGVTTGRDRRIRASSVKLVYMSFKRMSIVAEILVPQSLPDVWAFLSEPRNSLLWDKSVAAIEASTPGPVGLGWEGVTTAPSGMQQNFRISQWEPEHSFAFQLLESSMFSTAELGFQLEQTDSQVRITHRLDLDLRNPMLYPILKLTSKRALGSDLESLRRWLDKTYPPDPTQHGPDG